MEVKFVAAETNFVSVTKSIQYHGVVLSIMGNNNYTDISLTEAQSFNAPSR